MKPKINYKAILIIASILLVILSYSFVKETILPVFKRGEVWLGILGVISFIILIFGVSILALGAFIIVKDTMYLIQNNQLLNNVAIIRNKESSKDEKRMARKENFAFLISTWKYSFKYLGVATLLIVTGGIMLNITEGKIQIP